MVFRRVLPILCLMVLGAGGCDNHTPLNSPAGQSGRETAPVLPPQLVTPAPQITNPNQQLIEKVEYAYASGVRNYRSGNLTQARKDFDRAVDLLLMSGADLKEESSPLAAEFERVVDAVNALEMDALKIGNGFTPQIEATPADVASDITFTVDPKLKAKAQAELATTKSDIPLVINDPVAGFINFFSNSQRGRNTLAHSLTRVGRYKAMADRVLDEEGVPRDLIFQAVAESGFQPLAVNAHSGAGGMWQFMPHGVYGLTRNGYVDERFDPEKSTRAYARYIKLLYNQLGDWYLAMAAYDWGAGNVQRAVQRTGYADFWELYRRNNMPTETKNYVPEILAAIIIARNPAQYGMDTITPDPPLITDDVATNYAVDLRLAADIVEAPLQELVALNPSLLRLTTPPDMDYVLHLPPGTGKLFEQRIAEVPENNRRYWRYHKIAPGDTLETVAKSYKVAENDLAATNQISTRGSLNGVEALLVPVAPSAEPVKTTTYVSRKGDSLVTISDRFGITVDQLKRWNHLSTTRIAPGQRIHVAEPARVATVSKKVRGKKGGVATSTRSTATAKKTTSRGRTSSAAPSKKSAPVAKKSTEKAKQGAASSKKSSSTNATKKKKKQTP
jgi:membrane-bound lytic murein transglycosylase D